MLHNKMKYVICSTLKPLHWNTLYLSQLLNNREVARLVFPFEHNMNVFSYPILNSLYPPHCQLASQPASLSVVKSSFSFIIRQQQ